MLPIALAETWASLTVLLLVRDLVPALELDQQEQGLSGAQLERLGLGLRALAVLWPQHSAISSGRFLGCVLPLL